MSNSRWPSTSSSSSSLGFTDDEINELVLKLQALLPLLNQNPRSATVPTASKILEETCRYIKRLCREVDSLSERLSQLLDAADITDELIRSILHRN